MEKRPTPNERAAECIKAWHDTGIDTDVQGSYTGFYKDLGFMMGAPLYKPYDSFMIDDDLEPVQDADDL